MVSKIKIYIEKFKYHFFEFFKHKSYKNIRRKKYGLKSEYLTKRKINSCDFVGIDGNVVLSKEGGRYLFFKIAENNEDDKGISEEREETDLLNLINFNDEMETMYKIYGIKEKKSNLQSNLFYYESLLNRDSNTKFQQEVLREEIDKIKYHNEQVKCTRIFMIEEQSKNVIMNNDELINFSLIYGDELIKVLRALENEWWM